MKLTYFIKTFGCQLNFADSERIISVLNNRGMVPAQTLEDSDYIVINTCMVRESAENRVYGLINNLGKQRQKIGKPQKIVLTGCMVGMAVLDKSGKAMQKLRKKLPEIDEFLPINEIGFGYLPARKEGKVALVPISNGCNNFCSYCVVPFTRGKEVSRPFEQIINECRKLKSDGYTEVLLLGQNVNSYGSDLIQKSPPEAGPPLAEKITCLRRQENQKHKSNTKNFKPIYVKHMGKFRIPTLFPYLLDEVSKMGFERVDFMSSNPWDFSDELIEVIARNSNITRTIHLPLQSGDNKILQKMNRWYSAKEYLELVSKIRDKIPKVEFTTDIIVGFPSETDSEFENTVKICKKVGFKRAFVSRYSPRPMTFATKNYKDIITPEEKKKRWLILERLVNKEYIKH